LPLISQENQSRRAYRRSDENIDILRPPLTAAPEAHSPAPDEGVRYTVLCQYLCHQLRREVEMLVCRVLGGPEQDVVLQGVEFSCSHPPGWWRRPWPAVSIHRHIVLSVRTLSREESSEKSKQSSRNRGDPGALVLDITKTFVAYHAFL
jgi:hypothetical protein